MPPAPITGNPGAFSQKLNTFMGALNDREGGDRTGRQFTTWVKLRNKNYWGAVFANVRVMNTDDIAAVARAFNVEPFALITAMKTDNLDAIPRRNVIRITDYEVTRDLPKRTGDVPQRKAARKARGQREDAAADGAGDSAKD